MAAECVCRSWNGAQVAIIGSCAQGKERRGQVGVRGSEAQRHRSDGAAPRLRAQFMALDAGSRTLGAGSRGPSSFSTSAPPLTTNPSQSPQQEQA